MNSKITTLQYLFQKKRLLMVLLILLFTACYTVNDRRYLGIVFNDSKINTFFLIKYIDSVQNKGFTVPDSVANVFFNGDTILDQQRIVYFANEPKEWYLINFNAAPCWIESIYNPVLSNGEIYDNRFISKKELARIRNRFITQVLNNAEAYGKSRHLPDSVIYDTRWVALKDQ